jgi:lipid A 4'-phosphatase
MGFYFTAFSYIVPVPYQAVVFVAGTLFGGLVGAGRIIQGGHFFSDVIFSFLVIMIINKISFRIWRRICKKLP